MNRCNHCDAEVSQHQGPYICDNCYKSGHSLQGRCNACREGAMEAAVRLSEADHE